MFLLARQNNLIIIKACTQIDIIKILLLKFINKINIRFLPLYLLRSHRYLSQVLHLRSSKRDVQ